MRWGTPYLDLGWGTPHPDLRWGNPPPHLELRWVTPPLYLDLRLGTKCGQSENITSRHPSDAGGKNSRGLSFNAEMDSKRTINDKRYLDSPPFFTLDITSGNHGPQIRQYTYVLAWLITTRIRRMGEGYIFTLCVSPHPPAGTAVRERGTRRAICLLRSRRKTFLFKD